MPRGNELRVGVHDLHGSGCRLARGHGEKKTVQIVAIAALVLVVAGATYFFATGNRTDQYYEGVHFKCTACGHEFVMTATDVAKARGAAGNPRKLMTCPKCGKETGDEMTPCTKCGKWFLPKRLGDSISLKCSHCGYDPDTPPAR